MSWFQLDASTVASRVYADGDAGKMPTLGGSIARGVMGFTALTVAGFLPWVIAGGWLVRWLGEGGMLGVCAAVFFLLSGVFLHRLIIGPDSMLICYKLFSVVFVVFLAAWAAGWICLGGDVGSIAGFLAGSALVGWMLSRAFEVPSAFWKAAPLLFVLTVAGYLAGACMEGFVRVGDGLGLPPDVRTIVARLLWGACLGAGFGAGLGIALYHCQSDVREVLRAEAPRHAKPPED